MTQKIEIEWLDDDHDCETCGWTCARGAKVSLNGEIILHQEPMASCFGGADYSDEDTYRAILSHLGYEVESLN